MKTGTGPSIGVTRYYWYNYDSRCNQNPNAVKKSYKNMVFLNIDIENWVYEVYKT
jgi:hypothetical protein